MVKFICMKGKYFILLMILIAFACSSCEKFSGGNGDSITGPWRCREENGNNFRQYSVSIDRAGGSYDSTYFIIYNFHNLGFDFETYAQLKDSTLRVIFTDGLYNVSGKGMVSKNLKIINWLYSVSGQNVNDNYVTAYYYKQ